MNIFKCVLLVQFIAFIGCKALTLTKPSASSSSRLLKIRKTASPNDQEYVKLNNGLKMVFRKVLPVGMRRPRNNVVFEYDDPEEGKTCRCICQMR